MTIDKVVEELRRCYEAAKNEWFIRKPLSYALYHTWKVVDEIEKPRETIRNEELDETESVTNG